MLELAILGLLKERPIHGYELKKQLGDTLGHFWGVSYGSLYPALARLERAGAIEVLDPESLPSGGARPSTIPATGSIGGEAAAAAGRRSARPSRKTRTRKAYRITDQGQTLFAELLEAESAPGTDEDRVFALRLAFCRHLPPASRLRLFQRRRAYLVEKLARARRALSPAPSSSARADQHQTHDLYSRSLIEHGTETTQRDLEWVDHLIAAEQQGGTA